VIIPLAALFGVLLPAMIGGQLSRLAVVRLRAVPLLVAGFLAQLLVISVIDGPAPLLRAVHIASYLVAGWFVWLNRRIPGVPSLGLGAFANGVTIALNGGTLPAGAHALRTAGLDDGAGFVNSGVLENPVLPFLGDVFAIPASWPLANVFSIGDILIVSSVTYASLRICGTARTRPWQPAPEHLPPRDGQPAAVTDGHPI
jgi:hypothetical protein